MTILYNCLVMTIQVNGYNIRITDKKAFLPRLFFKEKESRYCHHSRVVVVGGGVVVVVVVVIVVLTNFNLGYSFISVEANIMKLHMLVHHHKGYNLTKGHNSAMLFFTKLYPFMDL